MKELKPLLTPTQKERNNRRKAMFKWGIVLFMMAVVFFVFYGDKFSMGKDDGKIFSKGSVVKGEFDTNKDIASQKGIVSKYSFPIPVYKPTKKTDSMDLSVTNAHAAVILDVDSGTLLYYKNGEQKRQIASLTKLMTAILVVENIKDLDAEIVTIDRDAVYQEGTKIGCPRSGYCISNRLKIGEKISAKSLLMAMLMNSANDSAVALANHIAGSQENFVKMMNKKAKSMGLKNTNFCTPSGLEIDGHEEECYSSAYDVARIAIYSMKYKVIWNIFKTPSTEIYSIDKKYSHRIFNTDRLLGEMPNCLGTKTGFTPLAGKSLMLAAIDKTKKHRVVAVVLDDPYRWRDAKNMVEWAFDSHLWK